MTYTILQAELAHGPCPACGQPISYEYAVDPDQLREIALSASILDNDPVDVTVVGIRINHDCIPATSPKSHQHRDLPLESRWNLHPPP